MTPQCLRGQRWGFGTCRPRFDPQWGAVGQGAFPRLALVGLNRNHEKLSCRRDKTEIMSKRA